MLYNEKLFDFDENVVQYIKEKINKSEFNLQILENGEIKLTVNKSNNKLNINEIYSNIADQGSVIEMNKYALMLYYGDGIEVNKKEAAKY